MELEDVSVTVRDLFRGFSEFEVPAGKTLKIKTSPSGLDILKEKVPAGELWQVHVNVHIEKLSV